MSTSKVASRLISSLWAGRWSFGCRSSTGAGLQGHAKRQPSGGHRLPPSRREEDRAASYTIELQDSGGARIRAPLCLQVTERTIRIPVYSQCPAKTSNSLCYNSSTLSRGKHPGTLLLCVHNSACCTGVIAQAPQKKGLDKNAKKMPFFRLGSSAWQRSLVPTCQGTLTGRPTLRQLEEQL